mmetsp:Transcript_12806/g.19210  ORF Transcript_12806/g.19210 Transcript_12806/m.19210 type:complete len:315 (-) Transcript_12806:82-1026(-)
MYQCQVRGKKGEGPGIEEAPKRLLNNKIKEINDDIVDEDTDLFLEEWQAKACKEMKRIDAHREDESVNYEESTISSKEEVTVIPSTLLENKEDDSILVTEVETARLLHLQRVFGSRHHVEKEVWHCLARCEAENGAMGLPTLQSSLPAQEGIFPLVPQSQLDPLVRVQRGLIKEQYHKAIQFKDSDFETRYEKRLHARSCVCGLKLETQNEKNTHLDRCQLFKDMWEALLHKFIHQQGIPRVRRLLSRLGAHRLCNEDMALCALAQCNGDIDTTVRKLAHYEYRLEIHRVTKIHDITALLFPNKMILQCAPTSA